MAVNTKSMNKLRRIWWRLTCDTVRLGLLIAVIGLLIISTTEPGFDFSRDYFIIFFASLLILYILGTMWTVGGQMEMMNEYITDDEFRRWINLLPYEFRDDIYKEKNYMGLIFIIFEIIIFTIVIIVK